MATAVLVLACGVDESSAPPAQVGEWSLTRGELADLLVLAQPFPMERDAVEGLARHWVTAAAVAHHVASGGALADDDAVDVATWLERREAMLALEREDRLGESVVVDADMAETTYDEGGLRLIAHVLRRVGPETSASEVELQRRTTQRLLEELAAGGPWDAAVAESEDGETRASSGLLGLVGPGELDPALGRVAFGLAPGQVSSVVRTGQGFHIVYRPSFADVAGLYAQRLRETLLLGADASSLSGLLESRGFTLAPEALATLRRMAANPVAHLADLASLAAWDNGAMPASLVARYLVALPGSARSEMASADADALMTFLEDLGVGELRISDAGNRGLRLDDETLAGLLARHAEDMSHWREALALGASDDLRASLRRYMEQVVSRQVEARPLSALFEAHLLEGVEWDVSLEGVGGALDDALAMLGAADSGTSPEGDNR